MQSRHRTLGRRVAEISEAAMAALVPYDWPGNVRGLQNVIDRALILSTGPTLHPEECLRVSPAPADRPAAAPAVTSPRS